MSRGARWTLGIAALFCAVTMFIIASGHPDALGGWLFGAFCLMVAALCFVPASRPVTARIIGASVFLLSVDYVIDMLHHPDFTEPKKLVNPIAALVVFGLPSGALMWTGRWPSWGDFSEVFNRAEHAESSGSRESRSKESP